MKTKRKYNLKRKYKRKPTSLRMSNGRLGAMKRTIRLKLEAAADLQRFKEQLGWRNPTWSSIAETYNTTSENLYYHRKRIMRDMALEKLLTSYADSPTKGVEQNINDESGGVSMVQEDS